VLRGLSIRGGDNGLGQGAGLYATGSDHCSILDCRLYENGRGVELVNSAAMTLEENRISGNTGDGLLLAGTNATDVRQNLIYGNGGDGVDLGVPSTGLRLEFNTLFRNGGDQVHESLAGGTGVIANNVLSEGSSMGFSLAGGTN